MPTPKTYPALLVLAINIFVAQALIARDYCQEHITKYQEKSGSIFHTRQARAEHLIDLIKNSTNKFNLINNLYLHYRSIDDVRSELSKSLELCLINLLNIPNPQNNRNFFTLSKPKFLDPVHDLIAAHIVNLNFYTYNYKKLARLIILDKLETGFYTNSQITKTHFDEALNPKLCLSKLFAACEKVNRVDYYGHFVFDNLNAALVRDVVVLVGTLASTEELKHALALYVQKPQPQAFDQIKIIIRKIYLQISGQPMNLSPSEYWGKILTIVETIKQELIVDAGLEAQKFRHKPGVMQALLIEEKLRKAELNVEEKIARLDIENFTKAYEKLMRFEPSGLGLLWSEPDTQNFVNLAKSFRALTKSIDRHSAIFDQQLRVFNGSKHQVAVIKNKAYLMHKKIIKLSFAHAQIQSSYDAQRPLLLELQKLDTQADEIRKNIQFKISRALSNCSLRNIEEVGRSASLMITALGEPHEEIRDRINSVFTECIEQRDCI